MCHNTVIHCTPVLLFRIENSKWSNNYNQVFTFSLGTGASCIYPLLGATMNGWYFLATEVDDICFNYAKKNVEQNNMSELIKGE